MNKKIKTSDIGNSLQDVEGLFLTDKLDPELQGVMEAWFDSFLSYIRVEGIRDTYIYADKDKGWDFLLDFYPQSNEISITWKSAPSLLISKNYVRQTFSVRGAGNATFYSRNSPSLEVSLEAEEPHWTVYLPGAYPEYSNKPTRPIRGSLPLFHLLAAQLAFMVREEVSSSRISQSKETREREDPLDIFPEPTSFESRFKDKDLSMGVPKSTSYYQGSPDIIDAFVFGVAQQSGADLSKSLSKIPESEIKNVINLFDLLDFVTEDADGVVKGFNILSANKIKAACVYSDQNKVPLVLSASFVDRVYQEDSSVSNFILSMSPERLKAICSIFPALAHDAIKFAGQFLDDVLKSNVEIILLSIDMGFSMIPMHKNMQELSRMLAKLNSLMSLNSDFQFHMVTPTHTALVFPLDNDFLFETLT